MDFTGCSVKAEYSDNQNGKEYDTAEVVEKLQLMGSMMSRSTLVNIETGRRNIKASDLKALKSLFDVDFDKFFSV